jgi:hypothetical protein
MSREKTNFPAPLIGKIDQSDSLLIKILMHFLTASNESGEPCDIFIAKFAIYMRITGADARVVCLD